MGEASTSAAAAGPPQSTEPSRAAATTIAGGSAAAAWPPLAATGPGSYAAGARRPAPRDAGDGHAGIPSRMKRNRSTAPGTILIGMLLALVVRPAAGAEPAPAVTPDDFPVTLSAFSTTLIGSLSARTQNLRLAALALDGTELAPGEALSFNRTVGARTLERGFLAAPVILHETRQLQTGGGVCQVASTLFAAALMAGLTPVERWRHSTPVDYIALGEDATIAWGAKDLRMRNELEQRVRLRIEVLGTTLTVRIEGEREPLDHFELEMVEAEAIPGTAGGGRDIELYRVRSRDGETIDRELVHRDRYPPSLGAAPPDGVR